MAGNGKTVAIKGNDHCLSVRSLLDRLQGMDEAALVLLPGREGGFAPVRFVHVTDVVLNVNRDPHFGPHDVPFGGKRPDATALVLLSDQPSGVPDDNRRG